MVLIHIKVQLSCEVIFQEHFQTCVIVLHFFTRVCGLGLVRRHWQLIILVSFISDFVCYYSWHIDNKQVVMVSLESNERRTVCLSTKLMLCQSESRYSKGEQVQNRHTYAHNHWSFKN